MRAASRSVDPRRVRRALELHTEDLGDGSYLVTGGAAPHVVQRGVCDCPDEHYGRSGACKHRLAVYLARQIHPRVLEALRAAIAPRQEDTLVGPRQGGTVDQFKPGGSGAGPDPVGARAPRGLDPRARTTTLDRAEDHGPRFTS